MLSHDGVEVTVSNHVNALMAAEQAKDLAKKMGFSDADQAKVAIVTSELARNIMVHAQGKGRIVIKPITEAGKVGVMVMAEDKGPGIADVEKALQEGNSSKTGLGIGLGGAKRLMDEFKVDTRVGEGTIVTAKKWSCAMMG